MINAEPSPLPPYGNFIMQNKSIIPFATVLLIPAAIEAIRFGAEIYKDPTILKKRFQDFKVTLHQNFCQQTHETKKQYLIKLAKNVTLIAVTLLIATASITLSTYGMPVGVAIAGAILTIMALGKTYSAVKEFPSKLRDAKNFIVDTFTRHPEEDLDEFKKRRLKGILKISLYTGLFIASIAAVAVGGIITQKLLQADSIWSTYETLPFQNKVVVFIEYALVSLAHTALAVHHLLKGNKSQAAFHFSAAAVGIAFPIAYLAVPNQEMRLHHSFLGLALMLIPSRSIQTFGTFTCIDSSMHLFGMQNPYYDYMNAIVDQISFVLASLAAVTAVEALMDRIFKKIPT